MSSQLDELTKKISPKLGVNDEAIINKAIGYLREINSKSIALNEMLKVTICLDIAASELGGNFDKVRALKYALNKSLYKKKYLLIKNLLKLENNKSVKEICIQLSCEEASKMAEKILEIYKENDMISRDFNHPQYAVAAVYTACKLNLVSVKKSDFKNLSTLNSIQWTKLETEFTKFANDNNFKCDMMMKKTPKKKGIEFMDIIEQKTNEIAKENKNLLMKETAKKIESYEDWKDRILTEAYAYVNKSNK